MLIISPSADRSLSWDSAVKLQYGDDRRFRHASSVLLHYLAKYPVRANFWTPHRPKARGFYAVARQWRRRHYVFGLSVRPFVPSWQILLPRYLMNGLSNLDATYREYSQFHTDDLIRFRRSKVKGRPGSQGIHVQASKSSFYRVIVTFVSDQLAAENYCVYSWRCTKTLTTGTRCLDFRHPLKTNSVSTYKPPSLQVCHLSVHYFLCIVHCSSYLYTHMQGHRKRAKTSGQRILTKVCIAGEAADFSWWGDVM